MTCPPIARRCAPFATNTATSCRSILALELDYLPGLEGFCREQILPHGFDYFVGSVHFVGTDGEGMPWEIDESAERFASGLEGGWGGDVRRAFEALFRLAARNGRHARRRHRRPHGQDQDVELRRPLLPRERSVVRRGRRGDVAGFQSGRADCRAEYVRMAQGNRRALSQPVGARPLPRSRTSRSPSPPTRTTRDDVAAGFTEAAALLRDLGITHVVARDGDRWIPRPID